MDAASKITFDMDGWRLLKQTFIEPTFRESETKPMFTSGAQWEGWYNFFNAHKSYNSEDFVLSDGFIRRLNDTEADIYTSRYARYNSRHTCH